MTLSVDQKLQMKRIKVYVKQQLTDHIWNKYIIDTKRNIDLSEIPLDATAGMKTKSRSGNNH